jgi:hypothetical protein
MRISSRRTKEIEVEVQFRGCSPAGSQEVDLGTPGERVSASFPFGANYVLFDKLTSHFNLDNPNFLCESRWTKGREMKSRWESEKLRTLFCRKGKPRREFSNSSHRHAAFILEEGRAEELKQLVATHWKRD